MFSRFASCLHRFTYCQFLYSPCVSRRSCFFIFSFNKFKLFSFLAYLVPPRLTRRLVYFDFGFVNCNDLLVGSFLLLDLQISDSLYEVIYLSDDDSRSVGFCECDALGLPRHIVFALPAVPHRFRPTLPVALPSPPDDSSRCARAAYMRAWHARVREARIRARAIAHASPRRSPRLARSLE